MGILDVALFTTIKIFTSCVSLAFQATANWLSMEVKIFSSIKSLPLPPQTSLNSYDCFTIIYLNEFAFPVVVTLSSYIVWCLFCVISFILQHKTVIWPKSYRPHIIRIWFASPAQKRDYQKSAIQIFLQLNYMQLNLLR